MRKIPVAWTTKNYPPLQRLLQTLGLLAFAFLLQCLLQPYFHTGPFVYYFPFLLLAGLIGNPKLFTVCAVGLAEGYLFRDTAHPWLIDHEAVRSLTFVALCMGGAMLVKRIRAQTVLSQEADAKLIAEHNQFKSVIANSLDAFIGMNEDGLVTHWNRQAEFIFGYEAREVLGRKLSDTIVPERYREAHDRGMQHYLKTGVGPVLNHRIEIHAVRKDGVEISVELSITPIELPGSRYFASFLRDITESKQLQKSLHEKIDELQKTQKNLANLLDEKDDFLTIVAHELRTPLTSLKLQIQLSERQLTQNLEPAQFQHTLQQTIRREIRQVDSVSHLVNDILDMVRSKKKKLSIFCEEFNLNELVRDAVDRHLPIYENRNIPLIFGGRADLLGFWDRFRIEQVVTNLLTNALRYGNELPVEIKTYQEGAFAVVEVKDHGIGIADEDVERIFKRFERIDMSRGRQGLGLGLYILKEIVDLHQGQIVVESVLGKGTTFRVLLPMNLQSEG